MCATHLAEFGIGRYAGSLLSTQLKVTGIDLFSAGDFVGSPTSEALVLRDAKRGIYKRIVIENNKVRGAVLYGDVKDGPWYLRADDAGSRCRSAARQAAVRRKVRGWRDRARSCAGCTRKTR